MKFSELKRVIDVHYRPGHYLDPDVVIQVRLPYATVGALPTTEIKNASMGFDWDAGKFIFYPDQGLTFADQDFTKQMQELQTRIGWLEYENRSLKAENSKLKQK